MLQHKPDMISLKFQFNSIFYYAEIQIKIVPNDYDILIKDYKISRITRSK